MDGSEDNVAYDNMLLEIIKREGKIDSFINIVFGFLQRNTDFFRIMPDPMAKFGFPPGVARHKIFEAMKLFEERSFQLFPNDKDLVEDARKTAQSKNKFPNSNQTKTPPAAAVAATSDSDGVTATTVSETKSRPASSSSRASVLKGNDASRASSSTSGGSGNTQSTAMPDFSTRCLSSTNDASPPPTPPSLPPTAAIREETVATSNAVPSSDFQDNPDTYNGAARDNYSWGQSIKDLDLRVRVDKDIMKGKQVRVELKDDHVKVGVQRGSRFETVVDGDLKWKVKESVWTLVPGEHVHISFEKIQERWWESCFKDEPEIELKSIDCSRPMEDLDDESLATVNKLKFDQLQKQMGKPTSDQQKLMDQLKDGWDAEGSPFKGKPFDPSVLDFGGS